jgi:hypothetical protein
MPQSHSEWVADGTPSTTPVTTSTPAEADAPAVETAAPAADTSSTASTASEAAASATASAAAAGASPAEAAAAGEQAAQDFIEGRYQDKPFKIPAGVQLPWKRGDEQGFVSIEEIRKAHMFERDYRVKTAQIAEQRRQMEVAQRVAAARLKAHEQWLEDQAERQAQAFADPEEQARYDAFLEHYRSDPEFRRIVDDARAHRADQAANEVVVAYEQQEVLQAETQAVSAAIDRLGEKYPGVDPDVVRQRYAQALQLDQLPLSEEAIEFVYRQEAQHLNAIQSRLTAPLQSELETLKRTIADLQKQRDAEAHNAKTREKIDRTVHPVGAPSGGAPPAPVPPSRNLKGKTLQERSREWAHL